ncbi:MAG: T9SS type A sorting domain-containing protein [Ignavibacteriaceae bacterium]
MVKQKYLLIILSLLFGFSMVSAQVDPDTAQKVSIDRFSTEAGHLFVRDGSNGFPGPNIPIDFDQAPFITKGLGPRGEHISYYNFDIQSTEPAPIYVLFREGESSPVEGQLNIVNVIPGDSAYNDFWEVQKVTVPADYIANTVTSYQQIVDSDYTVEETVNLVNCPIVPDSSTAKLRLTNEDPGLTRGWYDGKVVYYFNFSEKQLMVNQDDLVPVSPIYVSFNINPGESGGGPASGFMAEPATGRTHNVTATIPSDENYSPMWLVNVYDNADFNKVYNLKSILSVNILASGIADVNCPVVSVVSGVDPDTSQKANIDRFSMEAGHLFVRDNNNGLPGPDEPIDFDKPPFITKGLGPNGELIAYYNFDVQPTVPAPIYVLFKEGESTPVQGQMNIVDVIPGDTAYNDIWEIQKVTVPADYVVNTIISYQQIVDSGYTIEETPMLVNCPLVPDGSVARMRWNHKDFGLTEGWYRGEVVYYFNFFEKSIMTNNDDMIPLSPIYVSFNINPGQAGGGPPSGFKTDEKTGRTHNVAATLPIDNTYSPMWMVNIYDNSDFDKVHDLASIQTVNILAEGAATVNCPIVAQYEKIDRFSMDAAHLFVRDTSNNLPGPNEPIDFDQVPFITKGLGPLGQKISYYNFDVQSKIPAPIYVLFNNMTLSPINEQKNIVNVVPGDTGYNDFWEVVKVMVPPNYNANSITSFQEIEEAGYPMETTNMLVNCPVVPEGSTAEMRLNDGDSGLTWGWYKGKIIYYFNFSEKQLMADASNMIPESDIYVSFNINPGETGGGPASGFKTDSTGRAHNVTETVPADDGYSPLWAVNVYDNADFDKVHDFMSALSANILDTTIAFVNCPVVSVGTAVSVNDNNSVQPVTYSLRQNYPNPFNPTTLINFSIVKSEHVLLTIYNSIGQVVTQLINRVLPAGNHTIRWDAKNFASGVYLYTLHTGNFTSSKKMILLK